MSILLDALKKSEQERQLGQTPTLNTNAQGPAPVRNSGNPLIMLALVVLSAGIMAWFGWQQLRLPESAETQIVSTQAAQSAPAPVDEKPPRRTMTEQYAPDAGESAAPGIKKPGPDASTSGARTRLSKSVVEFKAEKDSAEQSAKPANRLTAAGSTPARSEAAAAAPIDSGDVPESRDGRRKGMEPHVTEPISYWELPQGIRDNLGEIKITVLVYSEEPTDRFVLSNGQRMVEKDQLDGGLVLEEIRRDGAVFLYRNYRFLVKG